MRKVGIVIGLGETGGPLLQVLQDAYGQNVVGFDPKKGQEELVQADYLNICIPYSGKFIQIVKQYQKLVKPKVTIVHSSVPIGTTRKIKNAVHSPINGRHHEMKRALLMFPKWVGGKLAPKTVKFFFKAGLAVNTVDSSDETEFLKLSCLGKYGVSLAYSKYQLDICRKRKFSYDNVLEWDRSYNYYVDDSSLNRPIIKDMGDKIGGHCVIPVTKMLDEQHPNPMLKEVLHYE